jgi:D-alanyl-D-alanine carboxypeptidase (penicillin-binding protein 5/6)
MNEAFNMRLMQSPWLKYGILLLSFSSFTTVFAATPDVVPNKASLNKSAPIITTLPTPPIITAKAFVLMDFDSHHLLASHNKDERVEPASLTKMMTVYVIDHALAQGKLRPQDLVPISAAAWKTGGSRTFLNVNTRVSVQELIRGIIIQSGNDASVAMAEHLAGSEESFAELMNTYAKSLGMTQTHFVNATGLPDPNHYTTTQDLAILANALIRDFPESYALYSQKEYEYQGIKQLNRNRLLWRNEAVDGIKTGFTDSAGYCLAASGKKGPMRLIAIVMGTKSDEARTVEANKLINYGFNFFETHKLYSALTPVKQTRIWMGKEKHLNLGLSNDLYITIPKGTYRKLEATIEVHEPLKAPTQIGQAIGTLSVQLQDQSIVRQPIVALQNIDRGSLLSRVYDYFHLSFEALWKKLIQT